MASGVTYWGGDLSANVNTTGVGPAKIRIACADASIYLSQAEAIALRDQIADALTQACIQRDAQQAAA